MSHLSVFIGTMIGTYIWSLFVDDYSNLRPAFFFGGAALFAHWWATQ